MAAGKNIQTFFDGKWQEGNPAVMCAADHGIWLGTLVFDGARAWCGKTPDLDLHCERVNASARIMGMNPTHSAAELVELAHEGLARCTKNAPVYIRPMYWSTENGASVILPDPESTAFCMCLEEVAMPAANTAVRLALSTYTRPTLATATVNCKAACLYPNNARMFREAMDRGFDNALVLDVLGNVAESASANIFLVKDGKVKTPIPNGTFLNGVTRQRIMKLLAADGTGVEETTLRYDDFYDADEIFLSGNLTKVTPVKQLEDRSLEIGPVTLRTRELYWDWAGFKDDN